MPTPPVKCEFSNVKCPAVNATPSTPPITYANCGSVACPYVMETSFRLPSSFAFSGRTRASAINNATTLFMTLCY